VQFDVQDFLKGAPLDQMNYVVAGVKAGIMTQNEAREYLGKANIEGGDELMAFSGADSKIAGTGAQDTGGGGGNQTKKMNIGTK
jgi:hypothetical protein